MSSRLGGEKSGSGAGAAPAHLFLLAVYTYISSFFLLCQKSHHKMLPKITPLFPASFFLFPLVFF